MKEPKFMQELHRIRAQMTKDWAKMTPKEVDDSLKASGAWLKRQLAKKRRSSILKNTQ